MVLDVGEAGSGALCFELYTEKSCGSLTRMTASANSGCEAEASVEHRRSLRGGHGEVAVGDSDLGLLCGAQNGKAQSQPDAPGQVVLRARA